MIEIGMVAKDVITGFTGRVTGVCMYISGCHQALLVPAVKADGSINEGHWFDLQRLEVTSSDILVLNNAATPGPDKAPARNW